MQRNEKYFMKSRETMIYDYTILQKNDRSKAKLEPAFIQAISGSDTTFISSLQVIFQVLCDLVL